VLGQRGNGRHATTVPSSTVTNPAASWVGDVPQRPRAGSPLLTRS
jgi:hypothetical protein